MLYNSQTIHTVPSAVKQKYIYESVSKKNNNIVSIYSNHLNFLHLLCHLRVLQNERFCPQPVALSLCHVHAGASYELIGWWSGREGKRNEENSHASYLLHMRP